MQINGTKAADPGLQTALPGAHAALSLLLAINLFNYIDRQVLAGVLPKIEDAFLKGDPDAKTKLGWLTTAFLVSYMLLSPLFGWLADRMSRWVLVGIGVGLWSLASGASGLAEGYLMLLLTRCFVGIGEAAYGPTAPGVISDLYPVRVRGTKMAWFYAAIPVGSALGYVLGGQMADSALGWRWAFFLVVPPGLLLALACYLMREPPRGQADTGTEGHRQAKLADYLMLLKIPSYVLNTLGMTALTFALGGLGVWMPTYIYEREGHWVLTDDLLTDLAHGTSPVANDVLAKLRPLVGRKMNATQDRAHAPDAEAVAELAKVLSQAEMDKYQEQILDAARTPKLGPITLYFGLIVVVSGFIATLLGGMLGDKLRDRFPGAYFTVSACSMMIGFPMILVVLWTPFPLAWVFVFIAVFALFLNTGPTNTILANVTHPAVRASAFALNILIIHAFGDVISPVIMGWIWDRPSLDRETARNLAMGAVSFVILLGGVAWFWGARYLERDTALAPKRLMTEPEA
jgi:MFS family permease